MSKKEILDYLRKIASKGGSKNTKAQQIARAKNALKGGRPKGSKNKKNNERK